MAAVVRGEAALAYVYLKAIHVLAAIMLISGMLLLAFALKLASGQTSEKENGFITAVQKWDRMVTAPALGVVWIAGIAMALIAEWYTSLWLMLKIVPVLFLSALHGIEAGTLRRMAGKGGSLSPMLQSAPALILVAVAIIAYLAVAKPF